MRNQFKQALGALTFLGAGTIVGSVIGTQFPDEIKKAFYQVGISITAPVQDPGLQDPGLFKSKPYQLTWQQRKALPEIIKDFDILQSSNSPENSWEIIKNELDKNGLHYEDLDPSGTQTRYQMEAEAGQRIARGCIENAKMLFKELKQGKVFDYPPAIEGEIDHYLDMANSYLPATAGKGYGILDESGTKTSEQIKAEIEKLIHTASIKRAREIFKNLKTEKDPETSSFIIGQLLDDAGIGYAALDPTGKSTNEEMEAEVNKRAGEPATPFPQNDFNDKDPKP